MPAKTVKHTAFVAVTIVDNATCDLVAATYGSFTPAYDAGGNISFAGNVLFDNAFWDLTLALEKTKLPPKPNPNQAVIDFESFEFEKELADEND